jgi:hypothetical protein
LSTTNKLQAGLTEYEAMTYAIIEAGGKQHRVQPGEVLKVEKIEAATGATINCKSAHPMLPAA